MFAWLRTKSRNSDFPMRIFRIPDKQSQYDVCWWRDPYRRQDTTRGLFADLD